MVELKGISKQFDGKEPLFTDLSLRIKAGEITAICGESGQGKTTLLKIISGLTPFDKGAITIGNAFFTANEAYPKSLWGEVGMIFQDHNLFPHLSLLKNITLPLMKVKKLSKGEAEKRAKHELDRFGIGSLAASIPQKISGGERQRAAIARTLAMDPLLTLFDEPTSSLDPLHIDEFHKTLEILAKAGATALLVTHNIDLAIASADRFALLKDGELRCSEDPQILSSLVGNFQKLATEKMQLHRKTD